MMLARVARHEYDGAVIFAIAAVGDHELQHARVKIDHLVDVGDEISDVAQCE